MLVFGGNDVNLVVNTVEEISSACVWDLVTDMNKLVFEKVRLGSEFRAQLSQAITTLTDLQLFLHINQSF